MHVAITGASSGIGASLARELARHGHSLTLVARRQDRLRAVADEIAPAASGAKVRVVPWDLSDVKAAAGWVDAAEDALGPIDVLVNNAGVQIVAPTSTVDPDEADTLFGVDLLAPLRLTRAVLPRMIARRSGTIVDVASMAALAPTPGMTHYNAAKAGLAAASESLRGELRGTGVHVVTVYPGIIASTEMAQAAMEKFVESKLLESFPRGTEEELSRLVRVAIERKHARVIYPRSGALSRWFPATTRWLMDRFTPALKALPASTAS